MKTYLSKNLAVSASRKAKLGLFFVLLFMQVHFIRAASPEKPNIILICADDLGWSDIGCYGSEIQTPNLDRLASQGIRFTNFHNTAKCFPSRASLLTGVYAHDSGYDDQYTKPLKNAVTIGEVLRKQGYATYWSGKHHGGENPIYRGFDHYYGLRDGCCNYFNPGPQRAGEPKPAEKMVRNWCIDSAEYKGYTPPNKDFYTTDYFTTYAIDYIDEAVQNNKPFFLYLAYTAPHDPLMAWPKDIKKYKGKYDVGFEQIRENRYKKQLASGLIAPTHKLSAPTFRPWNTLTAEEKDFQSKVMEVYAAMIDRLDQNIGRVLNELDRLKVLDNSIILFVSDNGANYGVVELDDDNDQGEIGGIDRYISLGKDWSNVCNTPFRFYKQYSYEGGINTPLIAWWPKKIKANSFTDFAGHFIDIMPTIIEITGAEYPETYNGQKITPMRGVSLLPALTGEKIQRKEPVYWQWKQGCAVLLDNWKIVKHGNGKPWDLYNMKDDPTETNNLAKKFPEKVAELDQMYNQWISKYNKKGKKEKTEEE